MTDTKRWLDDSPPAAVVRLLESARREKAPARVVQRALVVLGTTSAASGVAASGVAAAGGGLATAVKVAPSVLGIVVKWGGAGLVGGSVFVGAVAGVSHVGSSRVRPAPSANVVNPAATRESPGFDLPRTHAAQAPSAVAPPLSPEPEPASKSAAPLPTPSAGPGITAEIQLVDAARGRLRSGDGSSVLRLLAGYEQRFSPSHFEPEVLYLRMQASVVRGEPAEAHRLARLIVTRYPKSPEVGQAEALLHAPGDAREK